jgi:hypothetical protein
VKSPCLRCGTLLYTPDGREFVTVSLTAEELIELAVTTGDDSVRRRLICAAELIDPNAAAIVEGSLVKTTH